MIEGGFLVLAAAAVAGWLLAVFTYMAVNKPNILSGHNEVEVEELETE